MVLFSRIWIALSTLLLLADVVLFFYTVLLITFEFPVIVTVLFTIPFFIFLLDSRQFPKISASSMYKLRTCLESF
ncbi:hypothetical protein B0H11DRAFT_2263365 [Mycena galericulata]|nr:hypothetical protein B0H11DRAFT_2263365 [Mycena galericulata]